MQTFEPFITCVIDDALLEMMPDINQPLLHVSALEVLRNRTLEIHIYLLTYLLQFIDVMNLLDPLLHFSHILQSTWFRSVLLGGERSGKLKAGVSL